MAAPVVASAETSPAHATQGVVESRSAVPASAPPANSPGLARQRLLKNPEFRQALRNQQRQVIETEFRDLPEFLNLSPDEAARLFDLLAEQGVKILELQWRDPRSKEDGRSRQTLLKELRAQNDAELTSLLGGANMNRLQEFRSTLQSRAEVTSVRNELAMSSEPLREDQVEPMITLVNSELKRMNQELRELGTSQPGGVAPDQIAELKRNELASGLAVAANQRIVEAAGVILTSTQLAALKELYRRQRLQMEAQDELNRVQSEAMISEAQGVAQN